MTLTHETLSSIIQIFIFKETGVPKRRGQREHVEKGKVGKRSLLRASRKHWPILDKELHEK